MNTTRRRILPIVCGALVLAAASGSPARAQFGVFKRGSKNGSYQPFKDASGRFSLEYPAKDWRTIPGGGSVLVGFTHKDGDATVLVDYTKLKLALAPTEIDAAFAELEVQLLKEREPSVTDIKSSVVPGSPGPRIVIQFSRPGLHGVEQVLQYSIPVGDNLYRLVCTVRADKAEKNKAILSHMVESFAVAGSA
jgi:hypothetical protein